MKITRIAARTTLAVSVALGVTALASPAFAGGNGHFIGNATSASLSGVNLVVSFKEAGLASGSVETITASAHLDATYQCINGGGGNPADPKKTTVSTDVSQSGQFTAGQNGNVVGSLTITAPAPTTVLSCPSGQKATLTVVSYSNVAVTDSTSGASYSIAGTFTGGTKVGHGK
jgi:hypothetical protein